MKSLLALILIVAFASCNENYKPTVYPTYKLTRTTYLPDSNKAKYAQFIKDVVTGTNRQMTGGDYEDPEDVIEQAEETGLRIYSVETDALIIQEDSDSWAETKTKDQLTEKELKIMEDLKK